MRSEYSGLNLNDTLLRSVRPLRKGNLVLRYWCSSAFLPPGGTTHAHSMTVALPSGNFGNYCCWIGAYFLAFSDPGSFPCTGGGYPAQGSWTSRFKACSELPMVWVPVLPGIEPGSLAYKSSVLSTTVMYTLYCAHISIRWNVNCTLNWTAYNSYSKQTNGWTHIIVHMMTIGYNNPRTVLFTRAGFISVITFANFVWECYVLTPVYLFICLYVCVSVCYSSKTKSTERKCLKFGGMFGHEQGTNRLDFGSDRLKGKGLITR